MVRSRDYQAACRARPRTLPSPALPSSPINYTINISVTDMRGSFALLHHETRKHFMIFSFSLSLLNSIWTNFKEKEKKNLFFWSVHTFPLSAHRKHPANLKKALVAGKLLQTDKKAGHDFSFLLFPNIFILTQLINQTHLLIPHYPV